MNDSRALPPNPCSPPRGHSRSTSLSLAPFLLSHLPPPPMPGGGRLSRRGIHDRPERFHRIRACFAFLSLFFPLFSFTFSRGFVLKSMETLFSALMLVSLRSLVLFYLFFFFSLSLFSSSIRSRTFAGTSLKEGFRATESIEFRPTPTK